MKPRRKLRRAHRPRRAPSGIAAEIVLEPVIERDHARQVEAAVGEAPSRAGSGPTRTPASASPSRPARCSAARSTTSCPIPPRTGTRARQQHVLGAGLQPRALRQAHLLRARASRRRCGPTSRGGVDLRGRTVRNFYLEMSKGAYEVTGDGDARGSGSRTPRRGTRPTAATAGAASDIGHPDNPRGTAQMAIDAVEALAAAEPDFPWADYDVEDQGDQDGDGDLFEPDGVLDHVDRGPRGRRPGRRRRRAGHVRRVVERAGRRPGGRRPRDRRHRHAAVQLHDAGRGRRASASSRTSTATTSACPTSTTCIGPGDTDVAFWDLMSTGSHSGPLFQTIPAHMGAWSKYVLGWVDPVEAGVRRRRAHAHARPGLAAAARAPPTPCASTCPTSTSSSARRTAARTPGGRTTTRTGPTSA